jgi:hypothetical protein
MQSISVVFGLGILFACKTMLNPFLFRWWTLDLQTFASVDGMPRTGEMHNIGNAGSGRVDDLAREPFPL